jgi:hypothetical protein
MRIVSTAEWGNIVFGQNEASQDIANFAGDPAVHYRLSSSVIRAVPELDQMHPTVRLDLDPLDFKGDLMLISLLIPLAIACAALALAATIVYLIVYFIVLRRPNMRWSERQTVVRPTFR